MIAFAPSLLSLCGCGCGHAIIVVALRLCLRLRYRCCRSAAVAAVALSLSLCGCRCDCVVIVVALRLCPRLRLRLQVAHVPQCGAVTSHISSVTDKEESDGVVDVHRAVVFRLSGTPRGVQTVFDVERLSKLCRRLFERVLIIMDIFVSGFTSSSLFETACCA